MEIPFTAPLGKGFGNGRSLIIRGIPHHAKARFAITFLDELCMLATPHDFPKGRAVFHVSVRLDERAVVLNSADGGGWGEEERDPPIGHLFKLEPGLGHYEIKIECGDAFYYVFVNGEFATRFAHRFDMDAVTHLNFYGDFKIQELIYN